MIPEGSCDTEDLSNDAENSALHLKNKFSFLKYIQTETYIQRVFKLKKNISEETSFKNSKKKK